MTDKRTAPRTDLGSEELLRRGLAERTIVIEQLDPNDLRKQRARRIDSEALESYHVRRQLAPDDPARNALRYEAGARFRADYHRFSYPPRTTARYAEAASGTSRWNVNDEAEREAARASSRKRWQAACAALGPIADEAIECCCLGNAVGRDAMPLLRRALDALARFYAG